MEEGADVIVTCEILNETSIFVRELGDLLAEADTSCIDDGKVIAKGVEKFNGAGFKHSL
jgi:hypothetical protein